MRCFVRQNKWKYSENIKDKFKLFINTQWMVAEFWLTDPLLESPLMAFDMQLLVFLELNCRFLKVQLPLLRTEMGFSAIFVSKCECCSTALICFWCFLPTNVKSKIFILKNIIFAMLSRYDILRNDGQSGDIDLIHLPSLEEWLKHPQISIFWAYALIRGVHGGVYSIVCHLHTCFKVFTWNLQPQWR